MSRWFRHYAGMMRDEKLVRVALRAKQPVERVLWIWGAILESATEVNDGGRFDLEACEVAHFLRTDEADVVSILLGLEAMGRIRENFVVKWGDRQFQSDLSAERQRRYRGKQRRGENENPDGEQPRITSGDGVVTAPSRHGDAPDTETETNTEKKESSRAPRCEEQKFEEFWQAYPKRKGDNPKNPARKQFFALVKQGVDPDAIIRGIKRACERNREKIGTEFIPQAIKWLRDRRWEDYTDAPDVPSGPAIPNEDAVKFFKAVGRWHRDYGPEPGQVGCRADPELLAKFGYPPGHERAA